MRRDGKGGRAALAKQLRTTGVSAEAAGMWREFAHAAVREMLADVMLEEVELLCGPRHRPGPDVEHFRSGTALGYVLHEGRRMDVTRPRVRQKGGDGGTAEAQLSSYVNAQEPGELHQRMLEAFQVGVSSRDQKRLHGKNTPGVSKSEVSRLWRREGEKCLEAFRSRDIARPDWLVLML